MATPVRQLNVRQIENSLSRLKHVYAARVILNDTGDDVEEIHVLASPSRSPKQLVRDIESLLFVQFRMRIDYRRISLVQLDDQDLVSYFKRPKLVSVQQDTNNGVLTVEVALMHADGVKMVGKAQMQPDAPDECHAAASATIQAVAGLIEDGEMPNLQRAQIISFNGRAVALVHLSRQTARGEEHLLGASFADPDAIHGIVRATLDAVNRRFF